MLKTLVFGASLQTYRYANLAIRKLKLHKYPVIGIGGTAGEVEGIKVLTGYPALQNIHTISMYMDPDKQKEHYKYLLSLKPKRIIFNPGAENPELATLAKSQGIIVENACTLVLLSMGTYQEAA